MVFQKAVCAILLASVAVQARYYLSPLSYTKLPYDVSDGDKYKLFGGTAEESAYDPVNNMLYVVGK